MKKPILLLLTLFAAVAFVGAQDNGFDRRIDISRDYTVGVASAEKLTTPVEQIDTVVGRPTLSFGIRPTKWNSSFAASPLTAAELSASEWVRPRDFYLKAAAGYPLRSIFDLYYTPVRERRNTVGAYLNHEGVEGKVLNDMGERLSALSMRNRAGVFYDYYGRLSSLTANASYQSDIYNAYGGLTDNADAVEHRNISYNRLSLLASMKGRFAEGGDLDYTASLRGSNLSGESFGLRHNCTDYNLDFAIGGIGGDSTSLFVPTGVRVEHSACVCADEGFHNITVEVAPEWRRRLGGSFPIALSVGYLYNSSLIGSHSDFVFDFDARYDRNPMLAPFVSASRRLINNDFDALVAVNPYMRFGSQIANSMLTAFSAGVDGSAGALSYSLSAGGEFYGRYTYFALNKGTSPLFDARSAALTLWYAEAELSLRTSENFVIDLGGRYNIPRYDGQAAEQSAMGISAFEARARVAWTIARRLTVKSGVEVRGAADYLAIETTTPTTYSAVRLPATFNLTASVEYAVANRVSAFVEADNILNQTIYNYLSYRRLGFGVIGGVKITF